MKLELVVRKLNLIYSLSLVQVVVTLSCVMVSQLKQCRYRTLFLYGAECVTIH